MKIDSSQGNVEVYGDIREFKTSIDPKNLEFITTLLSSNLYSDPEQSFIREIVSNAWDSHVEAGTTDVPVIVRFKDTYSDKSVTIRDYGVGLSPERFQEVYCNIGSSTKRESNEFIGGFGIGKYSSLACSNTVYITSYYEGKAYYYVMVKSGNSITTNLVMEKPTSEKNGVEITIKNIYDLKPYSKALQYIIFFPNVYVDGAENSDSINSAKLRRFNNFAAASVKVPSKLLLGNVLYPCNKSLLSWDAQQFLNAIEYTGIVVKFDIGEINITPNRESIIYSSDTIKKIENRIKAAKAELDALVDAKISKDYDNILEYHKEVATDVYYDPVEDKISNWGYRVSPYQLTDTNITYRGVDIRESLDMLKFLVRMRLPNFKGIVSDDKIYTKRAPWNCSDNNTISTKKLLILNEKARLLNSVKIYLRENYDGYGVMTDITLSDFDKWMREEAKVYALNKNFQLIVDGIYEALMKKGERLDIETDPDFLKFKTELSANRSTDASDVREAILYVWNDRDYREKQSFKRFSHAVQYIKNLKKGVLLCNMDVDDFMFSELAKLKKFAFIKARKNIVADLRALNLKCVVDIQWVLKRDPLLSVVAALMKNFPGVEFSELQDINLNIDKSLAEEFSNMYRLHRSFASNNTYRSIVNSSNVEPDEYTVHMCQRLKEYVTKHREAQALVKQVGCNNSTITTAVVVKTKAYRISGEAYSRIKNNALLRVLCRK